MYRIAIIENEDDEARKLSECILKYGRKNSLEYDIERFADGAQFLSGYKSVYDVIFMDIMMPNVNGLSAAKTLRTVDKDVPCVFVTKMKQYALKGYEVNAFDFIVKPVDYNTFAVKMDKIMRFVALKENRKISISYDGILKIISAKEVLYAEVSNHDVTYHTLSGDYRERKPLGALEQSLSDYGFARISTYALVNLRFVERVDKDFVYMSDGSFVHISRTKKSSFLKLLASWLGEYSV